MAPKFKVEGFAETRDCLLWVAQNALEGRYGLTLNDCFETLEYGYQSVLPKIKDEQRRAQWAASLQKTQESHRLFELGDKNNAIRVLFEAHEIFTTLRRIGGKKPSRQGLGDTEHGANELDE
jgi:hypothetical protein